MTTANIIPCNHHSLNQIISFYLKMFFCVPLQSVSTIASIYLLVFCHHYIYLLKNFIQRNCYVISSVSKNIEQLKFWIIHDWRWNSKTTWKQFSSVYLKIIMHILQGEQSRFTVICMENNMIINNNTSINCFCILTTVNLHMPHTSIIQQFNF